MKNAPREILFRGKRPDNGEWFYGDLSHHLDGTPFIRYWMGTPGNKTYRSIEVSLDTVGQYTGLKDRTDRRIFEGDIIESQSAYVDLRGNETGRMCVTRYKIEWYKSGWVEHKVFDFRGRFIPVRRGLNDRICNNFRSVVGNIYDNPELMKEGDYGKMR